MLIENELLNNIDELISRHPDQLNALLESDAELIRLGKHCILAVTTDTIIEEINVGLYTDPYQIGWMMATSNFSDIAAVGAKPLGLLVNLHIPGDANINYIHKVYRGITDACDLYGAKILGGDTNHAPCFELGGTAIGMIRDERIITRKGCQPGDQLYASGKLGAGGFFALLQLFPSIDAEFRYLPQARIAEGQLIKKFGKTCIDTSDSLFPALSNMMEINKVGVNLTAPIKDLLDKKYFTYLQNTPVKPWFLLAGPHGEFELLFTVDPTREKVLLSESAKINWKPIKLGEIINESEMIFFMEGARISCNPDEVSNLYSKCKGNLEEYIHALTKQHNQWKQSKRKKVNYQ